MDIINKHLPSNCHSRHILVPKGIVLHHISGINLDKNKAYDPDFVRDIFVKYGVSAHYQINRDGSIWELVPPDKQAWHAGKSKFRGLTGLNKFMLGYEFVGGNSIDFTEEQYQSGAKLLAFHMQKYDIPTDWITMHRIVSDSKVRSDPKDDPSDFFDFIRLGQLVSEY